MTVLGIDTSSEASSVALLLDDGTVVEETVVDGRRHAEVLAPALARLASPLPPLSLIAVGVGPGPYTGLRVGIATAQAIGLALGVRVVGICSLDAIAAGAGLSDGIVSTDARRRERYWAQYRGGARVAGPHVCPTDEVPPHGTHVQELPSAAAVARLALAWQHDPVRAVDAAMLAAHGEDDGGTARMIAGATLLEPRPLYVRRADAAEPKAAS